jgi:hypothetical protein
MRSHPHEPPPSPPQELARSLADALEDILRSERRIRAHAQTVRTPRSIDEHV